MIKLAFCTDGIFPHSIGGMQRHSRLLIEKLAKYEIDITVFHPHKNETIFTDYENIKEIYVKGIDEKKNYLKENYTYSKLIYEYLIKMPIHVVYSQGLSVWFGLGKLPNKVIVNPHGLEPYQALSSKDKIIAVPFKKIFNSIFNKADKVVSLGGRLTDILKQNVKNKDKIVVLSNGVNLPDNFVLKSKDESPIQLLFVGRFASNKGIDLLLKVAEELNNEGYADKILYKLAGKGPLWEQLKQKYKLSNVEYLGFVSDEQLVELYSASHAFVLPTLFEGMPTVVHEAMTYSLPIIVSDVGATAEQVDEENGYLLPRNDKKALKEAIIDFVNKSHEVRNKMGEASLQRVKTKFLWNVVAKQHFDLFEKLMIK